MIGNDHARFWIGGGGSNPSADHTGVALSFHTSTQLFHSSYFDSMVTKASKDRLT